MSAQKKNTKIKNWLLLPLILLLILLAGKFLPERPGNKSPASDLKIETQENLPEESAEAPSSAEDKPAAERAPPETRSGKQDEAAVIYGEPYDEAEEVALYIHLYEELPPNYLTKKEAKALGWIPQEGNLRDVAAGMSLGGDPFGNREGLLPEDGARRYYECDVGYRGGARGPERLVYSDDGLIFYTADHYESFTRLY